MHPIPWTKILFVLLEKPAEMLNLIVDMYYNKGKQLTFYYYFIPRCH